MLTGKIITKAVNNKLISYLVLKNLAADARLSLNKMVINSSKYLHLLCFTCAHWDAPDTEDAGYRISS